MALRSDEGTDTCVSPTAAAGKFELNDETEARLLALYANAPNQLARLQRRIATAREHTQRIEELLRRRQLLQEKNRVLAASVHATSREEHDTASLNTSPSHGNSSAMDSPGATPSSQEPCPSVPLPSAVSRPCTGTLGGAGGLAEAQPQVRVPVCEGWARGSSLYEYGGPQGVTGVVSAVFASGQLFRVVTRANEWAFYNDTRHYEMHVKYLLHERSSITAAAASATEHATVTATRRVVKLASGQWEVSVVVPPEETAVLFAGTVAGYEERCKAVLLSFDEGSVGNAETDRRLCKDAWAAWEAIEQAAVAEEQRATVPSPRGGSTCGSRAQARPAITSLLLNTTSATSVNAAESVLSLCMRHRLPFVDPSFFPGYERLFRARVDAFGVAPLHWRPPRAFLPAHALGDEALFTGPVTAASVQGGALLPDHNVLSVIAALAELVPAHDGRPPALVSLFTHPETAAVLLEEKSCRRRSLTAQSVVEMERMLGAYRVQLCLSGWWRSLLVDLHVPATQHRPEFARCRDDLRALWLPLLEKVYAKAFGSYAAILEATVPDVVANLTGAPCCPLGNVWPPDTSKGDSSAAATGKMAAFVKLVKQHLRAPRDGRLLLRTFPLSLAKTKDRRDRLEEIYRTLGLLPGSTVLVLGIEELTTGHTVVRLRQNAPASTATGGGNEAAMNLWRQLRKPWLDALWELELTGNNSGGDDASAVRDGLWMDVADVPQFFQEGFLMYPTTAWMGGEVRVKGVFTGKSSGPSVCAKLELTARTTVMVSLTQSEQRLLVASGRLREAYGNPDAADGQAADPRTASTSALLSPTAEVRGLALQVFGRAKGSAGGHALLSNSTSPDLYATGQELQFNFHREAAAILELVPEHSPYYIVPRVSPPAGGGQGSDADVPYVLTVMAKEAAIGTSGADVSAKLSISFVELSPSAPLLRQPKAPLGSTSALRPAADTTEAAAEYQLCHKVGDHRFLVHNKRIDVV